MPIYTKTGDTGTTNLCNEEKRYKKSDVIFDVLGTFDELNSSLAFLISTHLVDIKEEVISIQNNLFELGALVSKKQYNMETVYKWDEKVRTLESKIDIFDAKNIPLKNFILPGGSKESSRLHMARAICRRLERLVVRYQNITEEDLSFAIVYLNRLSDFLFVLARYANKSLGYSDIVWKGSGC